MCLYASDAEIFDFRPGRYATESKKCEGEWDKIINLYKNLQLKGYIKFIFPSKVVDNISGNNAGNNLILESSEQPVPVKKQEKYSIYRWALTGKDDLFFNTCCYRIAKNLIKRGSNNYSHWKRLCFLWSSDIRTHINQDRFNKYRKKIISLMDELNIDSNYQIDNYIFCEYKRAGYVTNSKNFRIDQNDKFVSIETKKYKCLLNKMRGLCIDKLYYTEAGDSPILGTLRHGYYDDIRFAADFYSGHLIIEKPGQHKITSLNKIKAHWKFEDNQVIVSSFHTFEKIQFTSNYIFQSDHILIRNIIKLPSRDHCLIRPMNFTFFPDIFRRNKLFYAAHNGGKELERFSFGNKQFSHSDNLSPLISAKLGIGCTEGVVEIGDGSHKIIIQYDKTLSAQIPSITYVPLETNNYFLRLQYSAQEMDETFVPRNEEISIPSFFQFITVRIKYIKK